MKRRVLSRPFKCTFVVFAAFTIFTTALLVSAPSTSFGSINIVTNKVSTVTNCEKYTIYITSNGKFK